MLPLDESEWSGGHSGHFSPRKEPQYQFNRRLDGPCLDILEKGKLCCCCQ